MSDPEREHELSKDCWCQPTLDGDAPDGVSLEDQIEHQRSIYNTDVNVFGTENEWTIYSGSILASLLELQDRRATGENAELTKDQIDGVREFFALLDKVEESDSGRSFHPNQISSCRVMDGPKLEAALEKMRSVIRDSA